MTPARWLLRICSPLTIVALAAACSSDGGPSAPEVTVSLHLIESSASVVEANTVGLRLRGTQPDSITAVRIAGTTALAGVRDSTLLVVMPLGPAGSVTLEATAWIGRRQVTTSLSLTRAAGPSIGDPATAAARLLADLDAEIAAAAALAPVSGVNPGALAAERADIGALRDSLAAQLGRLDPTSRSVALSIMKQIRNEGTSSLSASAESTTCSTLKERVSCVREARVELAKKLVRAAIALSYIGGGAFAVVAFAGFTVTTALASAAVAGIVAGVLSFAAIDAKTALSDFVNSTYERAVEEVVRTEGRLAAQLDVSGATDALTASAVAPITMRPGVAHTLPIQRLTRSAVVGDTFPAVRGLADSVNLLAQRWSDVSARLPRPLRIPARTIGTAPARTRVEPADFSETSIVSIREGGASAPVTGTLTDAQPGINLTLSGNPGAGRDLTVRLALDGDGAGRVEFDVPIRYVAAPDTLDAIRQLFEGQIWGWEGTTFNQPWTVTGYQQGIDIAFRYCYGDPSIRVRCFGYRFIKQPDGTVGIVSTGSNGNTIGWAYLEITANRLFMSQDAANPTNPSAPSVLITRR